MLNGGTVAWSSKQQGSVSLSMTDDREQVHCINGGRHGSALAALDACAALHTQLPPTTLFNDDQSTIALLKTISTTLAPSTLMSDSTLSAWSSSRVWLVYCPTEDMIAGMLTKAPRSSTSLLPSGFAQLEGECWQTDGDLALKGRQTPTWLQCSLQGGWSSELVDSISLPFGHTKVFVLSI
jgi:hypothetical protein